MVARNVDPELRKVAYSNYLDTGLYPNTGKRCETVGKLSMSLSASRDSIPMAGPRELPLGKATTEAFWQASDEVHRTFDRALVDTEACLGNCAILSVEQWPDPQSPEE